ncbi:MAG: MXAN_5187 C-terminal domain-containing protein [Myxococcota bacterium]
MAGETIEEQLQILDHKLSQLKREYDQYFLGTRPREPVLLRGDVNKMVAKLSNLHIQNTGARFKFSSLCSRFQAFRRQWDETLRKIEAGTYERHQFKAKIHGVGGSKVGGPPGPKPDAGRGEDLFQNYMDARLACGESVKGLTREKVEGVIEKQRAQLTKKFGAEAQFSFRVAVEDGKVRLKASRKTG